MANKAFVILTHVLTPRISTMIDRARKDLAPNYDVWVIGIFADDVTPPSEFSTEEQFYPLSWSDCRPKQYPVKSWREPFTPWLGDADLGPLWLARHRPEYETIWLIEGDVDFTGNFRSLVELFENDPAELLTTNVRLPRPDWANARLTVLPEEWPEDIVPDVPIALLAAFRASRSFLERVEQFYCDGGGGHNEWTWPYVATASGLRVADFKDTLIDGVPIYTSSPDVPGLFPGSFRFRPPMSAPGERPMTLWHPVKDRPIRMGEYFDQTFRSLWQLTRNAFVHSGRS